MFIPWVTYVIFLTIAVVNSKSLINWVLLAFTLLLLFWHISADLVTKKSHERLRLGWTIFTFVAAVWFLIIIGYQILSLDPIANSGSTKSFLNSFPQFIVNNHVIIGLEDYTEFSKFDLAIKFLAYVAYFNLSVITRRQFERSGKKIKDYEIKASYEPAGNDEKEEVEGLASSVSKEEIMHAKFSLVFVVYQVKRIWPILDFLSWHTFTLLSIAIIILAIHWKLSIATMIYIMILVVYFLIVPFIVEPNPKKSGAKYGEGVSAAELKELWEEEDKYSQNRIVALKNKVVIVLSFCTMIFILLLHLSANFQALRV